ncbi:MAG: hypothetical protein HY047_16385 [Acidobacteria bacterium]|nr:hypothetical protein [Acidobacteriota bacterium]
MSLLQDLRFAIRLLIKDRWFTAVATLALALGIGVNATVFTFVNAALIRGLPFDDPDRIMSIAERNMVRGVDFGLSHLDYQDWRDAQKSFVGVAAWNGTTMNVSDEGRTPERYQRLRVLRRRVSGHRHHVRTRARAPHFETRHQRGAQGRGTQRRQRRARAPLDERAHRL